MYKEAVESPFGNIQKINGGNISKFEKICTRKLLNPHVEIFRK